MTSPKKPAPLATNISGSLGVDFQELSRLAGTLYSYAPQGEETVKRIDHAVEKTSRDARWGGPASKAFTTAWERTASDADKLVKFETAVGEVIDKLAVSLSWISESYDRKCDAYSHGEPIDVDKEFAAHVRMANEAERKAAKQLVALYTGQSGSWSLEAGLKELSNNVDLSAKTRKDLTDEVSKVHKDLADQLPDKKKKNSLWDDMAGDTGKGAAVGGVVGGVVGTGVGVLGILGGPTVVASVPAGTAAGIGVGGALGGFVGGVYGAFDHFF